MKAFVEHLAGVVRVGADCDEYGKPFEYAVAFSSADGKHAVVKALTADGKFTHSHARAVIAALQAIGLKAIWERFK